MLFFLKNTFVFILYLYYIYFDLSLVCSICCSFIPLLWYPTPLCLTSFSFPHHVYLHRDSAGFLLFQIFRLFFYLCGTSMVGLREGSRNLASIPPILKSPQSVIFNILKYKEFTYLEINNRNCFQSSNFSI